MANLYNGERYIDPTAYQALTNIERKERSDRRKAKRKANREAKKLLKPEPIYRPVVYICSPYSSGDIEQNLINARKYSRFAVDKGAIPIAPHLLFPQFMSEKTERELAMFMNKVLITKCSELWVFGNSYTAGMNAEIIYAIRKDKPIHYFNENMEESKV